MNALRDLAERQISSPRKARIRAAQKRADKKADDNERLAAIYGKWRRKQLELLLAGPHGAAARALVAILDQMTLNQGEALISIMEYWRGADADARFEALALVDAAIMRLREQQGRPVFDDPLPGEPLSAFLIIRELLR